MFHAHRRARIESRTSKQILMPKGTYTRKQASIEAFREVTGELLPDTLTFDEIRRRSRQLSPDLQNRCHERYLQLMSLGRPDYLAHKFNHDNRKYGHTDHSEQDL